jgi:hypothetical protein
MARRLFTIDWRDRGPERLATCTAPIPHRQGNALAGRRIHGHPDPVFVGLLVYKAPQLIGCGFQAGYHHRAVRSGVLAMEVIGARRTTLDHTVQEPRETASHGTAAPTECNALAQELGNLHTLRVGHTPVHPSSCQRAATDFTRMIWLPVASMAILLVSG